MLTDAILHRALRSGEEVLWTGEPRTALLTDPRDKVFVPLSLLFLLATALWTFLAFTDGSVIDVWIAAPYLLLALHLSIGRILLRRDRRRRTTFAVTDRRVLACVDGATLSTHSIPLAEITSIEIERDDEHGTATVRFAPTSRLVKILERTGLAPIDVLGPEVAFIDVERADRIPALIPQATVVEHPGDGEPVIDVRDHAPADADAVDYDHAADADAVDHDELADTTDLAARFDLLRKRPAS